MRKHIYVHTSDLDVLRDINEDSAFERVCNYDRIEYSKIHTNGFGRIKTDNNYYHILVGQIKQKNCPWCGSECQMKKKTQSAKNM